MVLGITLLSSLLGTSIRPQMNWKNPIQAAEVSASEYGEEPEISWDGLSGTEQSDQEKEVDNLEEESEDPEEEMEIEEIEKNDEELEVEQTDSEEKTDIEENEESLNPDLLDNPPATENSEEDSFSENYEENEEFMEAGDEDTIQTEESIHTENGQEGLAEENQEKECEDEQEAIQSVYPDEKWTEQEEYVEAVTVDLRKDDFPENLDSFYPLLEDDQKTKQEELPDEETMLKEIQAGEIVALASVMLEDAAADVPMLAASAPAYRIVNRGIIEVDEVSKREGYREIFYRDGDGIERSAPLYCMEASKDGMPDQDIREDAVRALNDSTIRKILYFGYGGPGDICSSYDPSCGHIRWERWENRYIFTHMALTKIYSGQYGNSNEAEYEHAGVNRFIEKIKSMTIPARDGIVFSANDGSGTQVTSKNLTVKLRLYPQTPNGWDWVDTTKTGFGNGFQISYNIKVTDTAKAGNTIVVNRSATSKWQMGYWKSKAEYTERGQNNPHIVEAGTSVTMKDGYYFCMAFPRNTTEDVTYSFKMGLQPVSFLLVDGNAQMGETNIQDFGVAVYQGERGTATLKLHPFGYGTVILTKSDFRNGDFVSGAKYQMYAADNIMEYASKIYGKGALVKEGTTNANGQISFYFVIPGKYYIKESQASSGYLLDTDTYSFTAKAQEKEIQVQEVPDLQADLEIEKVDADTGENLSDAEFTVYTWNEAKQKYTSGKALTYQSSKKRYIIKGLAYTETNLGKFRVKETSNPDGYTGTFKKDFSIANLQPGETKQFSYRATNKRSEYPHIEIRKVDKKTLEFLCGAEFTVYPWNSRNETYANTGTKLTFDEENEKYVSGDLIANSTNQGRFKVVETKNPEGYTGTWDREIDISDMKTLYQYTVKNEKIKEPEGKVTVVKKDAVNGQTLTGAVFKVYQWDVSEKKYIMDEAVDTLVYNRSQKNYQSGALLVTEENAGKFKIVETKNPYGYEGEWSKRFTINADGQEFSYEVENQRILGSIVIQKKIKEEDIVWAHGNPVFTFEAEGEDAFGVTRKYTETVIYYPDCYEVDEHGYAAVQAVIENVPLGNYVIYEKPVFRYYLSAVIADTENVRIHELGKSGYGKNPAEVAVAMAELDENQRTAAVTFVNEKSRYDHFSHTSYVKNTIPIIWSE